MKKLFYSIITVLFFLTFHADYTAHAAEDKTPPEVEEIKILTPEVAPGGKIIVAITVNDDVSGVEAVSLRFDSPNGLVSQYIHFWPEPHSSLSNTYTLEGKTLSPYAELGEWKLVYASVTDYAGNIQSYHLIKPEHTIIQNISINVSKDAPTDEIEIDDGFTAWEPKTDVPLNKEFTVTFNTDFDIKTILAKNVYILDQNGNNVPLMFIIDRGADLLTSQLTIAPVGTYRYDSTYTLYIKDIYSKAGKKLAYNTKMKFTTTK